MAENPIKIGKKDQKGNNCGEKRLKLETFTLMHSFISIRVHIFNFKEIL